ncbi:MAG: Beta-Casp domain protein [Methanosaeta sp. PtaB.Bin039]|nr:MAG: Beta-Casp domain protein [Methanosaeta sp. PtaB.Bin039]
MVFNIFFPASDSYFRLKNSYFNGGICISVSGTKLEFYGAAGGVTGSHMVLETDGRRIGIDAGLFQGLESESNWSGFGHDVRKLSSLLLTHAHVDHSGRIPLLVKQGFGGSVYSTSATADLCDLMLRDSAHLMIEQELRESRHPEQIQAPHRPALYNEEEALQSLRRFRGVGYGEAVDLDGPSCRFLDAGHILGSSMLELTLGKRKLVFGGDLGRPNAPFLRDPERVRSADWLVLESTYGDRDHEDRANRGKQLLHIVRETVEKGGNVVIPAFAVGRAQEILYEINPFAESGALKGVPCFLDSPMAISASQIYRRHPECFDKETLDMISSGDHPLDFPGIRISRSTDESKAINRHASPHIVISANGMATGGRILHHIAHNISRPESTIIFAGFQAEGTLGRAMLNGAKKVRIMGREYEVRARLETMNAFSAHAGRSEIMKWLRGFDDFPPRVFLNHGEPQATRSLAEAINQEFGAKVTIPRAKESYQLNSA